MPLSLLQGITFEEFRSFFQFLNNLEDFTIAMQMYNFASRSIGQGEVSLALDCFLSSWRAPGFGFHSSSPAFAVRLVKNALTGETQASAEMTPDVADTPCCRG